MEFNAIILCGKGTNLSPLSAVKDTGTPKALLPVVNKPMLHYVLEWCDQAPFKTVTVVSSEDSRPLIQQAVEDYSKSRSAELKGSSKLQCITTHYSSTGSVVSRALQDCPWLEHDNVVVLPCDFITDLPAQVLIELYRGNSDRNVGLAVHYNNCLESIDSKILKTNYTVYADRDDGSSLLLDLYSKSHVAAAKFLRVRSQLLWRFPEAKVSTNLLDSFIFFISHRMFDLVAEDPAGALLNSSADASANAATSGNSTIATLVSNRSANKIKRDVARRSWRHSEQKDTLGLFILPKEALFLRCNNLAVYLEANRYFLKKNARENAQSSAGKPRDKNSPNVGADCVVGEGSELGDRTNVKRSVLGANCKIGQKCRISGSVLLDGVQLDDDVHLENCIVGKNAKIESKTSLVNCTIEGSYIVGENVRLKGETLTNISMDELEAEGDLIVDDDVDDDDSALYSDDDDEYDEGGYADDDFVFSR